MASNALDVHPSTTVNRVASVDKKRMKVSLICPKVVSMYNKYMGGIDRFDENVDSERVSFRGKKTVVSIVCFWDLSRLPKRMENLPNSQERENYVLRISNNIVQAYLGMYKTPPYKSAACGSSSSSQFHPLVRTDNQVEEHSREKCNQARCAECHNRTSIKCKKCKVPLHISCWFSFQNK